MIIDILNETFHVEEGIYEAEIITFVGYDNDTKALVRFKLETDDILVKTYHKDDLGKYPWNNVFKELNTTDTDDLIGQMVEIEIKNNTSKSTNTVFSNIKRIHIIE